jgi:hypothetical protein
MRPQRHKRCTEPQRPASGIRVLWSRIRALLSRRRSSCGGTPPRYPDLPPDSYVREPRRPSPLSSAGAVALLEPNGLA